MEKRKENLLYSRYKTFEVIRIFPSLPISDVRRLPLSSRLQIGAKGDAGRASLPCGNRGFEEKHWLKSVRGEVKTSFQMRTQTSSASIFSLIF